MKLIIIYGEVAVGKLTTANELSKRIGYPVLHNHLTIDLVTNFFAFNSEPFYKLLRKIRLSIVDQLLAEKSPGLIWTAGFSNTADNINFYKELDHYIQQHNGAVHYIKLVCTPEEQKKRVVAQERGQYKKVNTLPALAKTIKELDFYTPTPSDQTLVIDNTNESVEDVVTRIIHFFSLSSTQ